jgi:hypothetical protein
MAGDPRRPMNQAWRIRACRRPGDQRCIVSAARRSVGDTTKCEGTPSTVRAYQINGESRFLSIEEAL